MLKIKDRPKDGKDLILCPACDGNGRHGRDRCWVCNGTSWTLKEWEGYRFEPYRRT